MPSAFASEAPKPCDALWLGTAFRFTLASLALFVAIFPAAISGFCGPWLKSLPQAAAIALMSLPLQAALLASAVVPARLVQDERSLASRLSLSKVPLKALLTAALTAAALLPALGLLCAALKPLFAFLGFETAAQPAVRLALNSSPEAFAALAATAILAAPLAEEIAFRKVVFEFARGFAGAVPAAVLSAGLFAFSHCSALQFPALFALGLALQWTFCRWGSLVPAIALHSLYNALSMGVLLALRAAGVHAPPF